MTADTSKAVGIGLLVLTAILLFVAYQENSDNASAVKAMNAMGAGGLLGMPGMTPSMPATTKYALFFSVLSGVGGIVCLMKARQGSPTVD